MREWANQSHVRWCCQHHVVFALKYRKKVIFGVLRKNIGKIIRKLCEENKIELIEAHAMPDHIYLMLSIPPIFSVANTIGLLKGKSAIRIHREYLSRERNFTGLHFWVKGYCVSTAGLDAKTVSEITANVLQEYRNSLREGGSGSLALIGFRHGCD
jgi:putative transposase